MATTQPILIAGGGIGGLALALALAQKGLRSTVLEAREQFATEGAGIQLGPNGVRVLQQLELTQALQPMVGEPEALHVFNGGSGSAIAALPIGPWMARRHGAPYWTIHRHDLHGALAAAVRASAQITVRLGFELASVVQDGEQVHVTGRSGERLEGAALVGADGLWSTVRQTVCPAAPRSAGATATRTVIPAERAGGLVRSAVGLWLSPGVHVVHYPVRRGSEVALVVIAAEDWQKTEWDSETDAAYLLARVGHFHRDLRDVLKQVRNWRKWGLFGLPPLPHWSRERVTLMGDAAHPMLPYLAQGGVLALEDAVVLADCLARHAGDEPQAFRRFEALRRKRASRVQALSRRNGGIYHLRPPLSWGRDAVLRFVPGAWLMSGYDWLYGWRGP